MLRSRTPDSDPILTEVKLEREAGLQLGGLLEAGLGSVIETVVAQAACVHGNGVSCVRVWC